MNTLKGKTAIVTGGARDIGRAISLKFASEGAKVCINYNESKNKAEETKKLIVNNGGEAIVVQGDLTKYDDALNLIEKCSNEFGNVIDILVNNTGGLMARKKLYEMDQSFF